jgi:hypothetical protein
MHLSGKSPIQNVFVLGINACCETKGERYGSSSVNYICLLGLNQLAKVSPPC